MLRTWVTREMARLRGAPLRQGDGRLAGRQRQRVDRSQERCCRRIGYSIAFWPVDLLHPLHQGVIGMRRDGWRWAEIGLDLHSKGIAVCVGGQQQFPRGVLWVMDGMVYRSNVGCKQANSRR